MNTEVETPLLVLGGYLGSGKTTLLNRLLGASTERIAVIVNDFGAINVDARLIESASDHLLELSNGCVCCSLSDGLLGALDQLQAFDPPFDRVLIEASGVADPGAIAQYGNLPGWRVDGVVVLAAADQLLGLLDDDLVGETVALQLRRADLVVLSCLDLVDGSEAAAVRARVEVVAPGARLLAVGAHAVDPAAVLTDIDADTDLDGDEDDATSSGGATHRAWTWTAREPLLRQRVVDMIDALPSSVVRAKGFVVLADADRPQEFHLVGTRWSLRPARTDVDATEVVFVAIGE